MTDPDGAPAAVPQGTPQPLTFTADPKLDVALQKGWDHFGPALAEAGVARAARWFARRAEDPELAESVAELLEGLQEGGEAAQEAIFALAEVAEEVEDDLLADTLWEGALQAARLAGDPDAAAEATARLAELADRLGDPLAAAEYWIGFLNWRRSRGGASDPGAVERAFDEIVRLAEEDGAQKEAALWRYAQARYTRLLEAEDERAVEGDWEESAVPYEGWA